MVKHQPSKTNPQTDNKMILFSSTVGAILLGLGIILFIASNWQVLPKLIKILIMIIATFSAYLTGYYFKFIKQSFPRVGASLIFLGTLLFGATIILISQIYNLNADSHWLLLIWLIGILPLVYIFKSIPITILTTLLFYVWMLFFTFNEEFLFRGGNVFFIPIIFLLASIALFNLGDLHYITKELSIIGRIYRLISLNIALIALIFFSFQFVTGYSGNELINRSVLEISPNIIHITIAISILSALAIIATNLIVKQKQNTSLIENLSSLVLILSVNAFGFFPLKNNFYTIYFNIITTIVIFLIIWIGYNHKDMKVINIGIIWLTIFIIIKYFDFFWDLMPRSLFFMAGGVILIIYGVTLEKKRQLIRTELIRE